MPIMKPATGAQKQTAVSSSGMRSHSGCVYNLEHRFSDVRHLPDIQERARYIVCNIIGNTAMSFKDELFVDLEASGESP